MPLSSTTYAPAPSAIGNQLQSGGANLPYRNDYPLNFPYSLIGSDYYAGGIQFLYTVAINVQLNPLGDFGSFNGNPIRQNYGELAVQNLSGNFIKRETLSYPNQELQLVGAHHRLSRQEASRPKTFVLSSRPRFLISSSATQTFEIGGRFATPTLFYNGSGTLTSPPNPFTESGTINPAATAQPTLSFPRRQLVTDVTDGDLGVTDSGVDPLYYTSSNFNNLQDTYRPARVYLYLLPGAVGSITIKVFKLTEPSDGNPNRTSVWVPTATFPAV